MSGHQHSHSPGHTPHPAGERQQSQLAQLRFALVLTLGFMLVEVAGGIFSGSLALLADAGHMLTDASALAVSLLALWLAAKPANARYTYGWRRAEVLAALANALTLLGLAGWIVYEALARWNQPYGVKSPLMMAVALVGLVVNLVVAARLHEGAADNLNIHGAWLHVLGDLLGSLGALVAGAVIHFTGWVLADLLASGLIAGLIALGAGRLLLAALRQLLDAVPPHLDEAALRAYLEGLEGVSCICDLHIWTWSGSQAILTVHLVVGPNHLGQAFLAPLSSELQQRFGIAHATIQLEEEPCGACKGTGISNSLTH